MSGTTWFPFLKLFLASGFFRAQKNMILWLLTYLLGLTFYLHGIISGIFHYFLLTKGKLFLKKLPFFFLIFWVVYMKKVDRSSKRQRTYLWPIHSMEINYRNTPFSHSTTTHCYILIKAFTGKGLFSLNIFFSSSENWKIKHFLSQVGTRVVLALLKEGSKDFCN